MKDNTVLQSVEMYPQQVIAGWEAVMSKNIQLPEISNIVVCGMGGSTLGARVLDSFTSAIPITIVNHYDIPSFVNEKSLVVISSYSGNTEETVSCFYQALERNTNIFAIATGGKIADIAQQNQIFLYTIDPKENPSGQPRLATGYSIGALFGLLSKTGIDGITKEELEHALSLNHEEIKHNAQIYRDELKEKGVLFVASEHLIGSTHAIKNMINESAKTFSSLFELPELNHHLMEGLKHPESLKDNLAFFFVESDFYHDRVKRRYAITKDVVSQNEYKWFEYKAYSETKLKQVFEVLLLGSYLQVYLGEYYKEDLTQIPWVDYFKEKLSS